MRAPEIQFASRPSPRRALGIVLLAIAAAICAAALWQYAGASRELERIEDDIRSATSAAERRRSAAATRAAPLIPEQRIGAINTAIAQLNVPWNALFAAFEAERPKEVAILALLPEARKRMLVVQAETLTTQQMVDFVDRLRAMPAFSEAVLVKHERREQDAGQPYRFAVEVHWKDER